jgi:Septum formation
VRALAGALVLVAVLAGCSTEVVEAGPDVPQPKGVTVVTELPTTTVAGGADTTAAGADDGPADSSGVRFAIGDCLTWDQSSSSAVFEVVDCTEEHLAEVAGLLDLSEVYPPDADIPSIDDLVAEGSKACPDIVIAYLGGQPAVEVEGGVLVPTEADWMLGGRTWVCTVGFPRVDGKRPAYTGRLAQNDAELTST